MKTVFGLTLAATLASSTAFAGGMAEPIMTMAPMEVMDESQGSSGNFIVPLILVALIAVAMNGSEEPVFGPSDARAKTDIVPVGTAPNGLPIYHYRYIGSSAVFEGVMAQDVLMHTPNAVTTFPSGLMAVNYDMLGMTLKIID